MLGKQSAPRLCGCGTRNPCYALSLLLPPSPPPSPASCVSLLSHCCDLVTPLVRCSCSCLNTWVAGCLTAAGASGGLGGGVMVWSGLVYGAPSCRSSPLLPHSPRSPSSLSSLLPLSLPDTLSSPLFSPSFDFCFCPTTTSPTHLAPTHCSPTVFPLCFFPLPYFAHLIA